MTPRLTRSAFSPTHHALLFAWISLAVIQRAGREEGERIVRRAVQRYGEQRGGRMALRAQANGHPLIMAHYLAYGEWEPGPDSGKTESDVIERPPHVEMRVHRCPWHTAWEDNDLMQVGHLYCQVIDKALVRGFNPDLTLEVGGTLSNGAPYCAFTFHDASPPRGAKDEGTTMPWDYHLGHLYATMSEVAIEELGEAGQEAADAALAAFADRFGREAAEIVKAYRDTDFTRLP